LIFSFCYGNILLMQIVFVNYDYYRFSSGVHIHFIANEMMSMGHECIVVIPEVKNTDTFGVPKYSFSDWKKFAEDIQAGRYNSDTVFHAWTPRDNSRIPTLMAARMGAPYFVHMEDNERRIIEAFYHKPFAVLLQEAAKGTCDFRQIGIHPILHQTFLAEAAGVSVLMDRLAEFVPPSVPTQLIWPACECEFFHLPPEPNLSLRRGLGIPDDAAVIVYPGNVHHANCDIMSPLYRALPLVEAAGHNIRLVRCAGSDMWLPSDVVAFMGRYVIRDPDLPSRKLPPWISMADILVQPGSPNSFDDYRFPSKLPLFLASGRPVILAKTNLGRFLTDSENCLILERNTPEAIAAKIVWLLEHPEESARIGHNGRKFAAQNFSWTKTAKTLLNFYEEHGKKRT